MVADDVGSVSRGMQFKAEEVPLPTRLTCISRAMPLAQTHNVLTPSDGDTKTRKVRIFAGIGKQAVADELPRPPKALGSGSGGSVADEVCCGGASFADCRTKAEPRRSHSKTISC